MDGLTDKPIMVDGISYLNLPSNRNVNWPDARKRGDGELPVSFEDELKLQLELLDNGKKTK